MLILDRYIAKSILATTGLVMLAFFGIDFFIQFVEEVGDIGKGDYTLLSSIFYVFLSLPHDVYQLFPMTGLIGGLLGLGLLASNNELVVMRASTMSIVRISRSVITVVLFMIVLVTLIGEGIAPYSQYYANQYKALLKSKGQAVVMRQGVWFRDGEYFIHIGKVLSEKHLENITRYHFNDAHQLLDVSQAATGRYQAEGWHVNNVRQSVLSFSGVQTHYYPNAVWVMGLNPSVLTISQKEIEEMSLMRLFSMMHYRQLNHAEYSAYALSFWQRLLQPFSTCVMILLVIPFIFGPLRTATAGSRLLIGAIVGFGFHLVNKFFGPLSIVYQMPPLIAAVLPTLLFFVLGMYFLSRVR
jgi:lipopolysaccharide export system permease protein